MSHLRAVSCLALVGGLSWATPVAGQAVGGLCEFLVVREGERVSRSDGEVCMIDMRSAGTEYRMVLTKSGSEPGCVQLDQGKPLHVAFHPRATVGDLEMEHVERGYQILAPQYTEERLEADARVVHAHPAYFRLAFCAGAYLFDVSVLHRPKGSSVPVPLIADLRDRARLTAERLAALDEPDLFGIATIREARRRARRLGLDVYEASPPFLDLSEAVGTEGWDALKQLERASGKSPREFSATEREIWQTVFGVYSLHHIKRKDELPESTAESTEPRSAFVATSASRGVVLKLGLAAMGPDPAKAHQARTALVQYAEMLRNMDLRLLEAQRDRSAELRPSAP